MTEIEIRPLAPSDLPSVAALWNRMIRDTAATFTSVEKTPEALDDWLAAGRAVGHPRLAVLSGGALVGFAAAGPFRSGPGYAHTLEHTVILDEAAIGTGAGRRLMARLEAEAAAAGAHSLIGAISGENTRALAFHARIGYAEVGRIPEAGFKFGHWLDLVLMQKILRAEASGLSPAAPRD